MFQGTGNVFSSANGNKKTHSSHSSPVNHNKCSQELHHQSTWPSVPSPTIKWSCKTNSWAMKIGPWFSLAEECPRQLGLHRAAATVHVEWEIRIVNRFGNKSLNILPPHHFLYFIKRLSSTNTPISLYGISACLDLLLSNPAGRPPSCKGTDEIARSRSRA